MSVNDEALTWFQSSTYISQSNNEPPDLNSGEKVLQAPAINNIIELLKFAAHSMGNFTLHFMFEISRMTNAFNPIILKIIDLFSNIIVGFYTTVIMAFKVLITNQQKPQPINIKVECNRPRHIRIQDPQCIEE